MIEDRGTQQALIVVGGIVFFTAVICLCYWANSFSHAWARVHEAHANEEGRKAEAEQAKARAVDSQVKLLGAQYDLALLERSPDLPTITTTIPQAEVDKMVRDYIAQKVKTIKLKVDLG